MSHCKRCGKPCERTWCSQACNAADRRAGRDATCENCGATFYLRAVYEAKGGGRFCSMTCRRAFMSTNSANYLRVGRKYVHRLVAEQKLGRPLLPGETVHHIDGDKLNNDPSNIAVLTSHSEHMKRETAEGKAGFIHKQAVEAGRRSGEARRAKRRHARLR